MAGDETVLEDVVQRVLNTGERLGGIVVLVVDVKEIVAHGVAYIGREQIVVHERLGGLAGELHHHARRRVCVHVGVLAGHVGFLGRDDLEEHLARFGFAGDVTLVAVSDVAFGHFLTRRFHELELDLVLDLVNGHLLLALYRDSVHDTLDEVLINAFFRNKHCFTDSGLDFFFVEADDSAVTLDNCLNHCSKMLVC